MTSIWIHIRYEWKMLYRSIPFWFVMVLFVPIMVLFYYGDGQSPYHDAGMSAVRFSLTLLWAYFAITLIAVESGRRERAERTDRLRETLPYPIRQWLIGRWLALLIPTTLVSWMPLFIYLREIGTRIFEPDVGMLAVYLACFAIPSWFAVMAGFAIGDRVPGGWSYVAGLAFYLTFNLLIHFVLLQAPSIGMALFDMFGYMNGMQFHDYSLLWGFYADGQHWLHRLFYLCLTVLIAVGLLMHYTKKRREGALRTYRWTVGIAFIIVFTIPFFYFPEASHRYAVARQTTNLAVLATESGDHSRVKPLRYQLDMQIGSSNTLTVQADIEMMVGEEESLTELLLYLDPLFTIKQMTVNGEPAQWEGMDRRGQLRIIPQKAVAGKFNVSVAYSGEVEKWAIELNYNGGEQTVRHAVVSSRQVWLPYDLVWYPMTSQQLRVMLPYTGAESFVPREDDRTRTLESVSYDLHITHRKPMFLFTSDFTERSESRSGGHWVTRVSAISEEPLMLMGGHFQLIEAAGIHTQVSLITPNQVNRKVAKRTVENTVQLIDRMYEFLKRTEAVHGFDVYLPHRLTLLPTHDPHYPANMSRYVQTQILATKHTWHFQYGWLEVDEAYPSGLAPSEWALIWQWMETLHKTDGTHNSMMWSWLSSVRDYVLADPVEGISFVENGLDRRVVEIFKIIGRERFEMFLWEYYDVLLHIDPLLTDSEKNSIRLQFLVEKLKEVREEHAAR